MSFLERIFSTLREFLIPFKRKGIWSWWQFSLWFWTKQNSVQLIIKWKTVTTIIFFPIWKETEIYFSDYIIIFCNNNRKAYFSKIIICFNCYAVSHLLINWLSWLIRIIRYITPGCQDNSLIFDIYIYCIAPDSRCSRSRGIEPCEVWDPQHEDMMYDIVYCNVMKI